MSLADEFYNPVGDLREHRLRLWDDQTDVKFVIAPPVLHCLEITESELTPYMNEEATFQSLTPPTRDEVLDALHSGLVTVTFKTADGDIRSMEATLNDDLIPAESRAATRPNLTLAEIVMSENPLQKIGKAQDPNLIKAYARDRGGWRSFRLERLIAISRNL